MPTLASAGESPATPPAPLERCLALAATATAALRGWEWSYLATCADSSLATAGADKTARLWDVATGRPPATPRTPTA